MRIWPDELFVLARQVLYQRDGEIIELARPDLAVSEKGSSFVAQVFDNRQAVLAVYEAEDSLL